MKGVDRLNLLTIALALLVLAYAISFAAWRFNDCHDRGGHIEVVSGERDGWVCDGAQRGWFDD